MKILFIQKHDAVSEVKSKFRINGNAKPREYVNEEKKDVVEGERDDVKSGSFRVNGGRGRFKRWFRI